MKELLSSLERQPVLLSLICRRAGIYTETDSVSDKLLSLSQVPHVELLYLQEKLKLADPICLSDKSISQLDSKILASIHRLDDQQAQGAQGASQEQGEGGYEQQQQDAPPFFKDELSKHLALCLIPLMVKLSSEIVMDGDLPSICRLLQIIEGKILSGLADDFQKGLKIDIEDPRLQAKHHLLHVIADLKEEVFSNALNTGSVKPPSVQVSPIRLELDKVFGLYPSQALTLESSLGRQSMLRETEKNLILAESQISKVKGGSLSKNFHRKVIPLMLEEDKS